MSLYDHWADGYKTLHGMTSHGFPNQFFTGFIQGGVSANTTAMFEQQAEHIAYIIAEAHEAQAPRPSSRARRPRTPGCRPSGNSPSTTRHSSCTALPATTTTRATVGEGIRSFLGDPYWRGFYAFDDC